MVRRIAVYGKGGIGKSTVSSNITAALSDSGSKVLQIGCDPKHDSTRGLIGGRDQTTVLDYLKTVPPEKRSLGDVVTEGYHGCLCVEAGGPEPGVGCAGRGIISSFELLGDLDAESLDPDFILYDVLGDVVCGGFAVPLRKGYADTVYIVTSGEFMAIYAANNILRGTANYDPDRIGGIIFNSRGDPEEDERIKRFSEAVNIPVIARIPRSESFMEAERRASTVVEAFPDSPVARIFRDLADTVKEGRRYTAHFLDEDDLEKLILGRERVRQAPAPIVIHERNVPQHRRTPYASRSKSYGEPLGGCAFSGASASCTAVSGLTTILHSPRSCAHFTMQLDGMSAIGSLKHNRKVIPSYLAPDVYCTDMKEQDMVFGGNERLKEVVEERISEGARNLAVITACPPGVIGDDTERICREAEAEHPGTRIALVAEDGNATGDFMQGVIDASIALVSKFSIKGPVKPYFVNLIGTKTMASSVMKDLETVTSLLGRMGIMVNCVLPGVTDIDRIADVSRASVNLRLNNDLFSEKICMFLKDCFGMDYLPVTVRGGINGTSTWLRCVGKHFGREDEAEKVIDDLQSQFRSMMSGTEELLGGKKAAIISLSGDVDWVTESLDAAGIEVVKGYVFYRSDYSSNLDCSMIPANFEGITFEKAAEAVETINCLKPDILLSMSKADVDPSIYQVRLPCAPETDPFAGVEMVYDISREMLAPEEEEWRKDVA